MIRVRARRVLILENVLKLALDGSPLQLEDIMKTSLLRHHSLLDAETTSFALSLPTAIFPLLSQGDHPTLGTPCWYLHPCQTDPAVNEIVEEVRQDDWTNEEYLVRWLEAWFMVIGTTVDFGA
jgi:ubiquitin-like-conjugating enzyme ATG10